MSIKSASIPVGATHAPSGGSATSLVEKSSSGNKLTVFLDDGSALNDQVVFEFSTTEAKANDSSPNGWTQARCNVVIKQPVTPSGGTRTVNTVRMEVARDALTTAGELTTLLEYVQHVLIDGDFTDFFTDLSLA